MTFIVVQLCHSPGEIHVGSSEDGEIKEVKGDDRLDLLLVLGVSVKSA